MNRCRSAWTTEDYAASQGMFGMYENERIMSRLVELPDDLYADLEQLPTGPEPAVSTLLAESLEGLLGTIDSSAEPRSGRDRSPFGDLKAARLEKQGLRVVLPPFKNS